MARVVLGMNFDGNETSFADKRGLRPNTRLNGERPSRLADGVTSILKEISVNKSAHDTPHYFQ